MLAPFALTQMDTSIALYSMAVKNRAVPRLMRNLQSLLRLRQKAWAASSRNQVDVDVQGVAANETEEQPDQITELLGWRTRLIERGAAGSKSTTIWPSIPIPVSESAAEISPFTQVSRAISLAFETYVDPSAGTARGCGADFTDQPANDFVGCLGKW